MPLPHQLANRTQAILKAPGLAVPSFTPRRLCSIILSFPRLSSTLRHIPTRYSPVRHSPPTPYQIRGGAAVRLACVRHAASVQSEPGSNSSFISIEIQARQALIKCFLSLFNIFLINPASSVEANSTRINLLVNIFQINYFIRQIMINWRDGLAIY